MPTTSEDYDRDMNQRLANLFRQNPAFSADYFARPPASDQSPLGRNNYARHQEAIRHVADLLQQEEAKRASGTGYAPAPPVAIERQIREAQDNPAFGDARHPDHARQVEHVGALYRQLSASK